VRANGGFEMNLFFQKEVIGEETRIVLNIEEEMELDHFALNMMDYNRIANLVPMQLVQFNSEHRLQYDIAGLRALDERMNSVLNKSEVLQILNSMVSTFEEVDAYMLSEDNLCLDLSYIFIDDKNCCHFLYLPLKEKISGDKMRFLHKVVESFQPNYADRDPYLFQILNAFGRDSVHKLADFKDILRKCSDSSNGAQQTESGEEVKAAEQPVQEEPVTAEPEASRLPGGIPFQIPGKKQNKAPAETAGKKQGKAPIEIPGKKQSKISVELPGKKQSKTPVEIPGKKQSKVPVEIPGKKQDKISVEIPGQDKVSFEIPGQDRVSFQIPGQDKAPVEIPEASKKQPKKSAGKEKLGLFGKKADQKQPESDVNELQSQASQQNAAASQKEDMYESYENTVWMDVPSQTPRDEGAAPYKAADLGAELTRVRTGETFSIPGASARVGSSDGADCRIEGNKTISRNHATITRYNDEYYIADNHSSNGTWVMDRRLTPEQTVPLQDGSRIKLSDEEFIFRRV
jgi:hypothetical protein